MTTRCRSYTLTLEEIHNIRAWCGTPDHSIKKASELTGISRKTIEKIVGQPGRRLHKRVFDTIRRFVVELCPRQKNKESLVKFEPADRRDLRRYLARNDVVPTAAARQCGTTPSQLKNIAAGKTLKSNALLVRRIQSMIDDDKPMPRRKRRCFRDRCRVSTTALRNTAFILDFLETSYSLTALSRKYGLSKQRGQQIVGEYGMQTRLPLGKHYRERIRDYCRHHDITLGAFPVHGVMTHGRKNITLLTAVAILKALNEPPPPNARSPISSELILRVVKMRSHLVSIRNIMNATGLCEGTVRNIVARNGLSPVNRIMYTTEIEKLAPRHSKTFIAEKLGISPEYVYHLSRKAGIVFGKTQIDPDSQK